MTPPLPVQPDGGISFLTDADPLLGGVIRQIGPVEVVPVHATTIFEALLRSIIYQQLHAKAAATIHARVLALLPADRAHHHAIPSVSDEALRSAGLSANKLRAIRDLTDRTLDGTVPAGSEISTLSDAELVERITQVRGIGPWTVHMLMIFHLGRPDVMPTGDFAIRKAFSLLYRRGKPVTPEAIIRHARRWSPYRSLASWYLWRSLDIPAGQS